MSEQTLGAAAYPKRPWLTIWTRPRETIRQIVAADPERHVLWIAAISGFFRSLERAADRGHGDRADLSLILIIAAIAGPIGGIILLYLYGWLVRLTGEWLGGEASGAATRAAVAWPTVIIIAASLIWILEIVLFGREIFMSGFQSPALITTMLLVHVPIALTGAIWALVVLAKCVGEVQGFSAWKGLLNVFLAFLLLLLPVIVIAVAMRVVAG